MNVAVVEFQNLESPIVLKPPSFAQRQKRVSKHIGTTSCTIAAATATGWKQTGIQQYALHIYTTQPLRLGARRLELRGLHR